MIWKDAAMEKLRRYGTMRQALSNIPEEINRLKEEMNRPLSSIPGK